MLPPLVLARRRVPDQAGGLPKTQQALAYAVRAHSGQRRQSDGAPFIEHPIEVAALLCDAGAPDHVIAAGLLHDTIEKTTTEAANLDARFGPRVTRLVLDVTEDEEIPDHDERKAAARDQAADAGDEALMIFAADKVSKVRELQVEVATARRRQTTITSQSRRQRFAHYDECLHLLEHHLPGSALVADLRDEIERVPDAFTSERRASRTMRS